MNSLIIAEYLYISASIEFKGLIPSRPTYESGTGNLLSNSSEKGQHKFQEECLRSAYLVSRYTD